MFENPIKIVLLAGLVVLCGTISAHAVPVRERPWHEKQVEMFPDGLHHDFGKVSRGTMCQYAFRIVNTSDLPLHILLVRIS